MRSKPLLLLLLFFLFHSTGKANLLIKHTCTIDTVPILAYQLYWDTSEFKSWYKENSNTKIMFQIMIEKKVELTLAGWACTQDADYSDYNPSINLKIVNDAQTNPLQLTDSTLIGNLKLKAPFVERIYKKLFQNDNSKTAFKYIVFDPDIDSDSHLYYHIYLTKKFQLFDKDGKSSKQVGQTDPSPPATTK